MATKKSLDANLGDYFIFFKPKDIVSGDFYWSAQLTNGNFALVTADSTGHGVPGAIMSLLNITSLEKAIEKQVLPNEILNDTRKTIIERLKNDGSVEGGKDGMDCSICVFDHKNMKLHIAAAHNPVWIIRAKEAIEIKADKMPVGKHDKQDTSFSIHEIALKKGDLIITLTDGFGDQFGGVKGKKFMNKKLRELIIENSHLPLNEQKDILSKTFSEWKSDLEQIDDVCVIGVRV
jgi:serine phosphatase RsbU (regulator of sigma subunit)